MWLQTSPLIERALQEYQDRRLQEEKNVNFGLEIHHLQLAKVAEFLGNSEFSLSKLVSLPSLILTP